MLTLLLTLAVTKPVHPVMRPLVLKVPGTQTVRVLRDLAYEQTPGGPQLADVYLPPKKSARRPVAIFIHGGVPPDVPRPKSWGVYESWGRTIAASGFVGVVFNHRLQYPDPHLLEAQADLDAILAYVKAHASEWNGDANRVALFAYSAGGPLLSRPLRDHPANIRCIETIATFVARAIEVNAPLTFVIHPDAPSRIREQHGRRAHARDPRDGHRFCEEAHALALIHSP